MSTALDPRISEFETQEQADSYDRWFRAKVQEAIDSKKPRIPHDQVMAEMRAVIEQHAPKKAAA
ncbi:MAG: stability determinant [Ottowia sp.]|uniref:type II toxin-antitoxin system RelB family antitoxin n=1 Tax=Ottowia sp. TaxID=1898956 RepID=UPI0039E531EE